MKQSSTFRVILTALLVVFTQHVYGQMTQYVIGDAGNELATRVRYMPSDGSSIIAGYTYDIVGGAGTNCQAIVMKVTSAGTIAWQKTFGVPARNNIIMDMIITQDNNIVVVGTVGGTGAVYADNTAAILKFNSTDGTLMWQKCLRDVVTTTGGELFFGVTELTDGTGRLVAVGAHNYTGPGADGMICVFQGATGTLIYNDVYRIASGDEFESVVTSADGASVYMCGEFVGNYKDGRVISYTPGTTTGHINWSQYFDFYEFGSLQDNFFDRIYLSGTKLVVQASSIFDYTTTGGGGQAFLTLNAADGSGAQITGLQNSGAAYDNSPSLAVVSPDHIFAIQSPASTSYDVMLWTVGVTTNTVITEITSLAGRTANPPVRFTSTDVGQHSVQDIRLVGSTLYMAGATNITSGYGNNDVYYVSSSTGLASTNRTCDTVHDAAPLTNIPFTNPVPSFDTIHFTPVYSTVDTATTHFNIKAVCGDNETVPTCSNSLTMPDSLLLCRGDTATIHATLTGSDSILSYAWTPATGLSSTTILDPIVTATTSGWYYLTANSLLAENLVINGDFSAGNVGFTSTYTYSVPPSTILIEGDYSVYNDPFGVHTGFSVFGDHTTGTGNMMIINGGATASSVWCETIPVTPNTNYDFSAWFADCSSITVGAYVPVLQFMVNGVLIGTPTAISAAVGTWMNFSATWNSGLSTTASICIYDETTATTGNDFVIDDISFKPICVAKDSVYVLVKALDTTHTHTDTTVCANVSSVTLTAASGYLSYLWSTGSTATTITVSASGSYWVYDSSFCAIFIDTFNVNFKPLPLVNLGNDTSFCAGDSVILSSAVSAGDTYLWSTGSTGDTIHVGTSGTYWLTVSNGCTAADSVHIVVSPHPLVNLGPDTAECQGHPIVLQSSYTYAGGTYLWSNTTTAVTTTVTATGTYWLQVTVDGCSGADTIHVSILYDTFTLYTTDTAICKGQTVQVLSTGNPLQTYEWSPTAGIASYLIGSPLITPDTSATYYVTVYYPGCPNIYDSLHIDVQPVPQVYLGGNRSVCKYDTIHITASVTPQWYTGYTYSWSPAVSLDNSTSSTVVFTAGDSTDIILTVTTPAGCKGVDSAEIIVHTDNFVRYDTSFSICPGDSVQLKPVATGPATYIWHPALYLNDSTSSAPWVHAITTQSYWAIATSQYGCRDTISANVTVEPNAVLYLGDSVTLYPGETYQIIPQTNCVNFIWFPPAGLNYAYISDPIASPEVSTKYIVYGTTEWGCKAKDSINIYVDPSTLLAVPNAFSPGNGSNNLFKLIKRGIATLNYFRIYNRWGNLVYESNDIDAGWDGTYNGKPQPFDVYVYEVEAVTSTGKLFHKAGNLTLLR